MPDLGSLMSSLPLPDPKTVCLSAGRHRSPHDGACVMELASMLGGESFSDHPRSVCPALAGFLRGYNDRVPDLVRQQLYPWAVDALNTRESDMITMARAEALIDFAHALSRPPRLAKRTLPAITPQSAGARAAFAVRVRCGLHQHVDAALKALYRMPACPGMAPVLRPMVCV